MADTENYTIRNLSGQLSSQNKRSVVSPPPFRWADGVVLLVCVAGMLFIFSFVKGSTPSTVIIYHDTSIIAEYPLATDRSIKITGNLGPMTIEIKNHSVRISSSTCPHQLCVRSGAITNESRQLVCVPNHILVAIKGKPKKDPIDAVAR